MANSGGFQVAHRHRTSQVQSDRKALVDHSSITPGYNPMASTIEMSRKSSSDGPASPSTAGTTPPNVPEPEVLPHFSVQDISIRLSTNREDNVDVPSQDTLLATGCSKEFESSSLLSIVQDSQNNDVVNGCCDHLVLIQSLESTIESLKKAVEEKENENMRGIDACVQEILATDARWDEKLANIVAEAETRRKEQDDQWTNKMANAVVNSETRRKEQETRHSFHLHVANKQVLVLEDTVSGLKTKISDLKLKYKEDVSQLQKNSACNETITKVQKSAIKSQEGKLKVAEDRCTSMAKDNGDLALQNQRLKSDLDAARVESSNKATNIAKLNEEIGKLKFENKATQNDFQRRCTKSNAKCEKLESQCTKLSSNITKLTSEKSELEAQNKSIEKEKEDLRDELKKSAEVQSQLKNLQIENKAQGIKLEQQDNKLQQVKKKSQKKLQDKDEMLDKEERSLQDERAQVGKLKREKKTDKSEHEAELRSLRNVLKKKDKESSLSLTIGVFITVLAAIVLKFLSLLID